MIKCQVCEKPKQAESFYKNDKTCKECRKAAVKEYRQKNIDKYREYDRQRASDPDRVNARVEYAKTERGKEAATKARKKWKQKNPVKRAAHVILGNAVRDGRVEKPSVCSVCGGGGRIHGHHDDYAKPLAVKWLCTTCHDKWHAENGEGINAS